MNLRVRRMKLKKLKPTKQDILKAREKVKTWVPYWPYALCIPNPNYEYRVTYE